MVPRSLKLLWFAVLRAVAVIAFCGNVLAQSAGQSFVIADSGPFRLVSTPTLAPLGLLATTISVETTNVNHRVVTLDNVSITGDVHQIWSGLIPQPTPNRGFVVGGPLFHAQWASADTHLLIDERAVGGGAGGAYAGISETNDGLDPTQIVPRLPLSSAGFAASAGIGSLESLTPTDAFFLDTPFQTNFVDFAYVVTPLTDQPGTIGLALGLQGGDEMNLPIGPVDFDITLPPQVFIPPCDFDSDYRCELADLDALLDAVGTDEERFNLEPGPLPIDLSDVDRWLDITGRATIGEPYVRGDTDLDGDVDAADLNIVGSNWQTVDATSWGQGDFNADGRVDPADLNVLGINWQHGVDQIPVMGVPEPSNASLVGVILFFCLVWPTLRRVETRCR